MLREQNPRSSWSGLARCSIAFLVLLASGGIALGQGDTEPQSAGLLVAEDPLSPETGASASRSGDIREGYLRLADGSTRLIEYEMVGGVPIFEGDIMLAFDEAGQLAIARGIDQLDVKSAGRARTRFLWPNGQVFYRIDPALPNPARVTSAIAHWQASTGLTFTVRTNQPGFINFRRDNAVRACFSAIGYQGLQQDIRLHDDCLQAEVIHEIGHAVGLWHEQNRYDRDTYVNIIWSNIETQFRSAFNRYFDDGNDGQDHGPYDFISVMHYRSNAFAINPAQPTITRRDGGTALSGNVLSTGDRNGVAFLYGGSGRLTFYEGNSATQDVVCQTVPGVMRLNFTQIGCTNDETRSLQLSAVPAGYALRVFDNSACSTNDDWTEIRVLQGGQQLQVNSYESSFSNPLLQVTHHHVNGLDGKVSCVWGAQCGDGRCTGFETACGCPSDCGPCPFCGDGLCSAGENCGTCQSDCGACPYCGDGICNAGEGCATCSTDCGACACNFDNVCQPGWEDSTCPDCCGGQIFCE